MNQNPSDLAAVVAIIVFVAAAYIILGYIFSQECERCHLCGQLPKSDGTHDCDDSNG